MENAWKNKKVRIAVIAGAAVVLAIIAMAVVSFIVGSKIDGVWRAIPLPILQMKACL